MTQEIMIFTSQFATVYLLGIQQLNVAGRHYVAAFCTSCLLGLSAFYLTASIGQAGISATFSSLWWSFMVAGPLAILLAMWSHPKLKRFLK